MEKGRGDAGIVNFFNDTLKTIFGLSNESVERIRNLVRSQGELQDLKNAVRQIDSSSYKRLNAIIDDIRAEHQEKDTSEEEDTSTDDTDDEQEKDVKENENLSFLNYLMEFNNREASKQLNRNRQQRTQDARRSDSQQNQKTKQEIDRLERSSDPEERELAKRMKRTAQQQKKVQQKRQNNESCEVVYVDPEDNSILTEGAVRAYKRYGQKMVKKYRCIDGPKAGKLVSDPSACAQRKDPKKIKQGRKTMRSKKSTIQRKSQVSKKQALSKRVTQMNKRLTGDV